MSRYTETAEYYAKNQRCKRCGKQDAYTLNGRSFCYECAQKKREHSANHYKQHKDEAVAKMRERRERLTEEGVCYVCGKRKADSDKRSCAICRARANARHRKSPRDAHYCFLCNKRPRVEGTSLCEVCLPAARDRAANARNIIHKRNIEHEDLIMQPKGISYDTTRMETCEYIEAMKKSYFKPPKQENGLCQGFKNRYSGVLSTVCSHCEHVEMGSENDI